MTACARSKKNGSDTEGCLKQKKTTEDSTCLTKPLVSRPGETMASVVLTDFWISLSGSACVAASHFAIPPQGSTTPQMGGDERNPNPTSQYIHRSIPA